MSAVRIHVLCNPNSTDDEIKGELMNLIHLEHPGDALVQLLIFYAPKRGIVDFTTRLLSLLKQCMLEDKIHDISSDRKLEMGDGVLFNEEE